MLSSRQDTFSERLSQMEERFTGLRGGTSYGAGRGMGHLYPDCLTGSGSTPGTLDERSGHPRSRHRPQRVQPFKTPSPS